VQPYKLGLGGLSLFLLLILGCNKQSQKMPFIKEENLKKTSIKGKVDNWPTDTIYFASLPFHSPYSTFEGFHILKQDKTFKFAFDQADKPFILLLTPEKRFLDHRNFLLFESFTPEYYQGYCKNFFTMPMTTYLIEPGTETIVELSKTTRYGHTEIRFLNENAYNSTYYQSTFDLDQKFDEVISSSESLDEAVEHMIKKEEDLLESLEKERDYISPFVYNYTKAEIKFGAKKELLRFLLIDHPEIISTFIQNETLEIVEKRIDFDGENIDYATIISQEYNEFLELYINLKYSAKSHELVVYKAFDKEKYDLVSSVLPQLSKYLYLANNLLHSNKTEQTRALYKRIVKEYPEGELNAKLINKFN
jgi:hypothetical protein